MDFAVALALTENQEQLGLEAPSTRCSSQLHQRSGHDERDSESDADDYLFFLRLDCEMDFGNPWKGMLAWSMGYEIDMESVPNHCDVLHLEAVLPYLSAMVHYENLEVD